MKRALPVIVALVAIVGLSGCGPKEESVEMTLTNPMKWGYVDGEVTTRPDHEVKNTKDKAIYLHERYELTKYRIAVPNGKCTVKLHFAETYEKITEPGQRVFTVSIEGKPVLVDFDPFTEACKQQFAAVVKEFKKVEVKDGELTIEFQPKVQNAMINGIEVRGKNDFELRINCGADADYTDKAGHVWKKDQAF
ncbi:MAG: malectin domain-containing carbohydrate-binding protein [Planctomycetota bacterium]|nr:malectin domain-containing carbohydrate-binding protein [Planctomycetota bacterium]